MISEVQAIKSLMYTYEALCTASHENNKCQLEKFRAVRYFYFTVVAIILFAIVSSSYYTILSYVAAITAISSVYYFIKYLYLQNRMTQFVSKVITTFRNKELSFELIAEQSEIVKAHLKVVKKRVETFDE